jgi:hypothetical protein
VKATVSILVMIVTALDLLGVIDLPLYASIGFFFLMTFIVLSTVTDVRKDKS